MPAVSVWRLGVVALYIAFAVGVAIGHPYPDYNVQDEFSDPVSWLFVSGNVVLAALVIGPRWALSLTAAFVTLVPLAQVIDPCHVVGFIQGFRCTASVTTEAFSLFMPAATISLWASMMLSDLFGQGWQSLRPYLLALGGAALIASLFLPWYGGVDDGGPYTDTGWNVFESFQVFLVVVAASTIIGAVVTAWRRARTPDLLEAVVALLAATALGLVFYRLFTPADGDFALRHPTTGAFVALGAATVMTLCGGAARKDVVSGNLEESLRLRPSKLPPARPV